MSDLRFLHCRTVRQLRPGERGHKWIFWAVEEFDDPSHEQAIFCDDDMVAATLAALCRTERSVTLEIVNDPDGYPVASGVMLVPYPFCRTPRECDGHGYCHRDPACNN